MESMANVHPNVLILDRQSDQLGSARQDIADFLNAEAEPELHDEVPAEENAAVRDSNDGSTSTQAPDLESRVRAAYFSAVEELSQRLAVPVEVALAQRPSVSHRPLLALMLVGFNMPGPGEGVQHRRGNPVRPRKPRHRSVRHAYWKGPKMTKTEKKNRAMKVRRGERDGLSTQAMAELASKFAHSARI